MGSTRDSPARAQSHTTPLITDPLWQHMDGFNYNTHRMVTPECYSRMWNMPGEALGHPEEPPAGTLCRFSLYSLLGSRPSATIITLFFPKKILAQEEEEEEKDVSSGAHLLGHPPLHHPLPTCCASRRSAHPSACCSSCWPRRRRRCTCRCPHSAAAAREPLPGQGRARGGWGGEGKGRGARARARLTSAISACLASSPLRGVRVRDTAGSGESVRAGRGRGWGTARGSGR